MSEHTPGPWRLEYDEDGSATMLYGADDQRLADAMNRRHPEASRHQEAGCW